MKTRRHVAVGLLLLALGLLLAAVAAGHSWLFTDAVAPLATTEGAAVIRSGGATVDDDVAGKNPGASRVPTGTEGAATTQRIKVLVVTTDGNPVAGATIRFWPQRSPAERERDEAVQEAHHDDEVALATGASRVADASGVAWIEATILDPIESSPLIARRGELYGVSWVSANDEQVLLELRRDVNLDIEVVDTLGRPRQGQVVQLVAECVSRRQGLVRSAVETLPTDANGKVRMAHAQLEFDITPDAIAGRLVARCERRATDTKVTLAEQAVELARLGPQAKLRLVVPAGGSIGARITDADGATAFVNSWLRDDQGETFERRPACHDDRMWFHGVPLGRSWTLVVNTGGAPDANVPVRGPVTVDDIVTVDVPLASRWWRFHARLLRSDGVPIPRAEVEWGCAQLPLPFKTSPDWRAGLSATLNSFPPDVANVTRLELRVKSPMAAEQVFRFAGPYAPGKHELGDLVLSSPTDERLLARVEVRLDGKPGPDDVALRLLTGSRATKDEVDLPIVQRRAGNHIELLGVPPPAPLQLACEHYECLRAQVPVAVGEHRVLELQRAARLRLAVVPPEVAWDALGAELQCLDAAGDPATASLDSITQTFDWRGLVPGRYRLRVEAFGRELHTIPELRLLAGANAWPADGSRVDLRGKMRTCCIAAHAADDPAKRQLYVDSILVPEGADLPAKPERHSPNNTFAPLPTAADLLIRTGGFVPVRMHDPRSDVVLALQPLTRLEFPANPATEIRIHVVADGVRDAMLRAFDVCNRHDPEKDTWTSNELVYAPGTELDIRVLRDGKPGPTQRVLVGSASPQNVALR